MKTTYKAISKTNLTDFNIYCTEAVQAGFVPVGGITVSDIGTYTLYVQAFMYYEKVN